MLHSLHHPIHRLQSFLNQLKRWTARFNYSAVADYIGVSALKSFINADLVVAELIDFETPTRNFGISSLIAPIHRPSASVNAEDPLDFGVILIVGDASLRIL